MPDVNRDIYDDLVMIITKLQHWDDIVATEEYPCKTKFTFDDETLTIVFRYGNTVAFIGPKNHQYIEYSTSAPGQTAERIAHDFADMAKECEW